MDLEQRIRELCSEAIAAKDPRQFEYVMAQLSLALHERTEQMRKNVSDPQTIPSDKSLP